ncbi:MAG: carbohydrate ABC transporter permease [Clostridia bacterium]|nr:carbohydrate ABC transporter permease [Clostridia bacterium]
MVFPFIWALSVSLQGPGLAYITPPRFFKAPFYFSNYSEAFAKANMFRYFLNSLFIAVLNIIGAVASNSFIGFGFARYQFKGSQVLFFTVLCTMMLPGNITAIVHYIMWQNVGALDTYIPLIVPSFFGSAMMTFLFRQHFLSIPTDIYSAALVDGASPPRIFMQVYMPMSKPIIATVTIQTFLNSWNNMFQPLIYLTTKSKYTISVGLLYLKGTFETNNTEILIAASVLAMLPAVVLYFFAQKQFVQGMVSAAVKG